MKSIVIELLLCVFVSSAYFNFSPLTVENFREIIQMICDDVINMAIAENVIYEAIKNPTISAQKVSYISHGVFYILHKIK